MTRRRIDLNCDLGESFGAYTIGHDELVMSVVTSANVACGFHASDPTVMRRTVHLARENGVKIGGGAALNVEGIVADLPCHDGPAIVVHGANALRDEMAHSLGIERRTITVAVGCQHNGPIERLDGVTMNQPLGRRREH